MGRRRGKGFLDNLWKAAKVVKPVSLAGGLMSLHPKTAIGGAALQNIGNMTGLGRSGRGRNGFKWAK